MTPIVIAVICILVLFVVGAAYLWTRSDDKKSTTSSCGKIAYFTTPALDTMTTYRSIPYTDTTTIADSALAKAVEYVCYSTVPAVNAAKFTRMPTIMIYNHGTTDIIIPKASIGTWLGLHSPATTPVSNLLDTPLATLVELGSLTPPSQPATQVFGTFTGLRPYNGTIPTANGIYISIDPLYNLHRLTFTVSNTANVRLSVYILKTATTVSSTTVTAWPQVVTTHTITPDATAIGGVTTVTDTTNINAYTRLAFDVVDKQVVIDFVP